MYIIKIKEYILLSKRLPEKYLLGIMGNKRVDKDFTLSCQFTDSSIK